MRREYLFPLANVCHITPLDVDRLKCRDFFQLVVDIDAYHEANQP